jgi:carbon monoxide dehydrogenase subunit G
VIQVNRDADWTFRELHDPEKLVARVPGGSLTRLIDHRGFEGRFVVGAGPFKTAYAGTGPVVACDSKRRTATLLLSRGAGPTMPSVRVRMTMAIHRSRRGSEIEMAFQVRVADGIARIKPEWVDCIARQLVARTIDRMRRQLQDHTELSGPTAA